MTLFSFAVAICKVAGLSLSSNVILNNSSATSTIRSYHRTASSFRSHQIPARLSPPRTVGNCEHPHPAAQNAHLVHGMKDCEPPQTCITASVLPCEGEPRLHSTVSSRSAPSSPRSYPVPFRRALHHPVTPSDQPACSETLGCVSGASSGRGKPEG